MSVSLTIDGTERSALVNFESLRRSNRLNETADQLSFSIKRGGNNNYTPSAGDEVVLTINSVKEFGGVIVRVQDKLLSSKLVEYKVTCKDHTHTIDRKIVTETYENTTVEAIIQDVIDNYTTGFTYNGVSAPVAVGRIVVNRLTPTEIFNKLSKKSNYSWYVDYDKDVHFFARNNEPAPFNLTDDDQDDDYGKYIYKSLEKESDITQLKNVILVEGGETVGTERTVTWDGNDVSSEGVLDLQYKFSEKPTVEVDSVVQDVGIEFLDDEADHDVLWNFNEKYLKFPSGSVPASGDVIEITGTPLIPIIVRVPDNNSIAEFGEFTHKIKDKTIRSQDEAVDRALAEIKAYADSLVEGSFETYNQGLRAGQILQITDTFRNINESVLIQGVDLRSRTPDGSSIIHTVSFATFKSIGILEFLHGQLEQDELEEQQNEELLSFVQVFDEFGSSDTLNAPTTSTEPYKWAPSADSFSWNFGKWS